MVVIKVIKKEYKKLEFKDKNYLQNQNVKHFSFSNLFSTYSKPFYI